MDVLVLGGTAWLGGRVAATAVARGHRVTCLARRGAVPDGATAVRADRTRADALDAVRATDWDVVVDVASDPGQVRSAVTALEPVASRYVFVSTCSVYASHREPGADEDAALLAPAEPAGAEGYGAAKVACENAVRATFGDARSLVARSGLIGGPGDPSGRTDYWPWRFARPVVPGRVLAPDVPGLPVAVLDVRDLADWLVRCGEDGTAGVMNAQGDPLALPDHLAVARAAADGDAEPLYAPPDWLTAQGVQAWSGPRSLPLWLDDVDWFGMSARSTVRARHAGLTTRPLVDTLRDGLAWRLASPEPADRGAGLTDAEERALLAALPTRG